MKNSKTLPKMRGTALITLDKVGCNPVSYNIDINGQNISSELTTMNRKS